MEAVLHHRFLIRSYARHDVEALSLLLALRCVLPLRRTLATRSAQRELPARSEGDEPGRRDGEVPRAAVRASGDDVALRSVDEDLFRGVVKLAGSFEQPVLINWESRDAPPDPSMRLSCLVPREQGKHEAVEYRVDPGEGEIEPFLEFEAPERRPRPAAPN